MAGDSLTTRDRLMIYCSRWSHEIGEFSEESLQIDYFRRELPHLLRDRALIRSILEDIRAGLPWPDIRKVGLFQNEVLLHVDDRRRFSIRVYFHAGGEYTVIHDHNAWGVSGVSTGKLGVVRYRIEDIGDETKSGAEGDAPVDIRPARIDHQILPAGEIAVTRPLAPGIHQTGNPTPLPNMMVTVYGRPVRRLYIQEYDPVTRRVFRRYPPKLRKQRFAGQVLKTL